MSNVSVIGIGAMGGGIARALLHDTTNVVQNVSAYDLSSVLVQEFFQEAQKIGKADSSRSSAPPSKLSDVVSAETDFVIVVLLNEQQCEQVSNSLLELMPSGSCVIIASTVTAAWMIQTQQRFHTKGIHFLDCPTSGGPVRARNGELSLMVSGDDESLAKAKNLLDIIGKDVHIIAGGAGMGSTVKMVHQLLAGVHIAVAAEALALAAKAGLDVQQVYEIVNGAAGASWMFQDRGQRMLDQDPPCKSQGRIFVKDLDICYAEAKRLQSPIPIASAALQQFISSLSLGLGTQDDSQVVQVYERITGVSVAAQNNNNNNATTNSKSNKQQQQQQEGTNVGDTWMGEEILEVGDEPRHHVVLVNDYVRAIRVSFPPNDTTAAHRHAEDSLYFFLVEGGLDVVNDVQGASSGPACDCMDFGEVRFGAHKETQPLVHRITNKSNQQMLCIDAELLRRPPVSLPLPLVAPRHELIKTRDKCRIYKLTLEPDESIQNVSYPFFHLSIMLHDGKLQRESGGVQWTETVTRGDLAWKEPTPETSKTNVGTCTYVEYIAEWR